MRYLLAVLSLVCLCSCATLGSKMTHLSPGMTKKEVLDVMGDPDSSKGQGDMEVLVYQVNRLWSTEAWTYSGEYWCVLQDGKLTAYGKPQDVGRVVPTAYDITVH